MSFVGQKKLGIWLAWAMGLSVAAILIALGFWQLERAEEKRRLTQLLESRRRQQPIRLNGESGDRENLRYHRVFVSGLYDFEHQFLLDNQVVNGQVGAFVLTPLKIDGSQHAVLVNRGWVPMINRRIINNDLDIPQPWVRITGVVNHFPGVGWKLYGAEVPSEGWPGLIQLVDAEYLSRVLGYPLLPFQVLLDPDLQPGFSRKWNLTIAIGPEKHRAYAVQWFALAAVFIGMLFWITGKQHD